MENTLSTFLSIKRKEENGCEMASRGRLVFGRCIHRDAVSLWSLKQSSDVNGALNKPTMTCFQQDTPELYRYSISNPGTASAYLSYVDYYVDSKPVDIEVFRKAIVDYVSGFGVANQLTTTFPGSNSVLAAGDSIDIVRIQFLPTEYSKREQRDPSRFRIKIGYKSALGETDEFDSAE